VRVDVRQRGFRTKQLVLVTTLLDAQTYGAADLAELYRRRWQAEIFHPHYTSSDILYRGRRAA
jgi:IS4 transposase